MNTKDMFGLFRNKSGGRLFEVTATGMEFFKMCNADGPDKDRRCFTQTKDEMVRTLQRFDKVDVEPEPKGKAQLDGEVYGG